MERAATLPFDDNPDDRTPQAFGRYRVLNPIGQGSWGPVFRARDSKHHVAAIIKTFGAGWPGDDVWRLSEELVGLVASPRPHDALALLFGAGVQDGVAFLAMQAETDEPLEAALPAIAPAPVDRALTLLDAIAQAIDAAWREGMGHGALHPRDIFVTPGGELSGITGFGVSQAMDRARHSAPARRVYTAPERWTGSWGVRADVFSLGAIAHELLTGRRPIGPGEQDGELGTDVPAKQRAQIRRVLASALAGRPEERFASARAFVSALAETAGFRLETGHSWVADGRDRLAPASEQPASAEGADAMTAVSAAVSASGLDANVAVLDHFSHAVPSEPVQRTGLTAKPVLVTVLIGLLLGAGAVFAVLRPRMVRLEPPSPQSVVTPLVTAPALVSEAAAAAPEPAPPVAPTVKPPEPARTATPRSEPAGQVATIVPVGSSRAGATAAAAPPSAILGAVFGAIDVDSRPRGARVTMDGHFVGTAPLRLPEMSPGAHTIILEVEGRPAVTRRVQVEAGQTARVSVVLD